MIDVKQLDSACAPLDYGAANISNYVEQQLGLRCAETSIRTPTIVIYALILALGVVGNVCTCLVIIRNKSMQTITNYYLFSLALSDLLMLVLGLPVELYDVTNASYPYRFGISVCRTRAFLTEFTSYASVLTITSFSLERWLAICHPLRAKKISTFDRAVKLIITAWLLAFVTALPVLRIVVINPLPLPDEILNNSSEYLNVPLNVWLAASSDQQTLLNTGTCAMDFNNIVGQQRLVLIAFIFFFVLPAVVITVVYAHILLTLRCSNRLVSDFQRTNRHRKSLLRMLVSVVLFFFICWLPYHCQRLISTFADRDGSTFYKTFLDHSFYLSGYFYYSNSCCNPILYNILSTRYRRAFCKTILCRGDERRDQHQHSTRISNASRLPGSSLLSRPSCSSRSRSLTRIESTISRQKLSSTVDFHSSVRSAFKLPVDQRPPDYSRVMAVGV